MDDRDAATSLEDSVDYMMVASDLGEKAGMIVVDLGRLLPVPLLADVPVSDLEASGVKAFDDVEGGAENVNGHALGHNLS